jgi:hypothetical protein
VLSIALVDVPVASTITSKIEAIDPDATEWSVVTVMGSGSTSSGAIYRSSGAYHGDPNVPALKAAAAATGGALYEKASGAEIPSLFRRVMDDLRSAYVLTYTPKNVAASGWHEIAVHTKDASHTIRARSGYQGRR